MSELDSWINPRHLDPEAVERLATAYASDPLRTVWLDDFLLPHHFSRFRRLFSEEGEFADTYGLRGEDKRATHRASAEEWNGAEASRRFHHEQRYVQSKPEHRLGAGTLTYVRFCMFQRSAAYRDYLRRLTGVALGEEPRNLLRITRCGHHLDRHNDAGPRRALCSILYFSEGWDPKFGGRLRQYRGSEPYRALDPLANRFVLFCPIREEVHDVEPLSDHAVGWDRYAMTTWYPPDAGLKPESGCAD
ncbi:2OG-Fe(II) oxygenase [Azospirillum sp.]|uniref:2OG-Fe(II) oxygenase n=1 Tax=Azospirillum sp. TaxID=34012 RepID=UPI002D3E2BB2|nr:2OG-Fe(II) oxygenase [Azospirillum sp.]HYD67995.1 2OG-Fe(II) oxygenase [Azospirillum sp.]